MTSSSSSSPEIPAATATDHSQDRFSYKHATHEEVLEDLCSRFILNLPDEELVSLERICFQVEQAHWFYEDFIREENPKFPSLPLKKFSAMLFHACPLLHQWRHDHEQAFNTFMQYKTRVPVCGAIMLNDTWEKCVLVKGWKASSGWGFPKGKINEDEPPHQCAVREVLEETGYNLAGQIDPENVIEMSIKEQKISLFIVPGVPEDYTFKTKTRKEISKIEWFNLTDLPTWRRNKAVPGKFYLISPFIGPLKTFINERKPRNISRKSVKSKKSLGQSTPLRNDLSLTVQTSYTSYSDATQESSSQSSSADNGDPQTPSPQYPQPVVHPVVPVDIDDGSKLLFNSEGIDPHFARLLSSLSLSAAKNDTKICEPINPVYTSIDTTTSQETQTPVVDSNRSSTTHVTSDERSTIASSTSTRRRDRSISDSPAVISEVLPTNSKPTTSVDGYAPQYQPTPLSINIVGKQASGSSTAQEPPPASARLSPASSLSSCLSPRSRGMGSRRTSSTADISPYLQRPMEIPTSAKKLKQLALLESIADESARMTPFLAAREPLTGAANVDGKDSIFPGLYPPPSVPPFHPHDPRIIYSSRPAAAVPATLPSNMPLSTISTHSGPYQGRPQTSHAYHRSSTFSPPGINQTQPLAMMNGPHSLLSSHQPIYASPIQGSYQPIPRMDAASQPVPNPQLPLSGALPGAHLGQAQIQLLLQPTAPHPPRLDLLSSPATTNHNAHLLSILNGNKSPQ